ncbi:UDP-N-acetylmuramyl pentapeptide phosphotransferase/UDP-N-acetylglucosamine-1-phosphate transferase [Desulfonispora thiosulfatigenes DSM 11270]|uniref:UDP-N-acetylmuramyl pentapeptide phosphotransferase/UDP-N-acetylglucosamine-1-phosphate transferase n=1 Tax=Desulfonispora thiosulfatigenes DSM 11270 TaxID=656914 RepID=A0A1W1VNT4_DESTI|nr:hypothetical protein [Desulfonispora thiosulfatigenes]SMB95032.1 UDP-N-acetylmuramyl pentapeptide phosphotransferase/UDP-N-acetylglucosamine-1-phosphate transferase [Desulfonispora thiosulfatigenes DSM 11270]
MKIFLIYLLAFILTKISSVFIANMLIRCGAVRANFEGKDIPVGMGLTLFLGIIPSYLLINQFSLNNMDINYLTLFILTVTVLVGFIDDIIGETKVKGLKGHLKLFFTEGTLTTGALKAFVISLVSLFYSLKVSESFVLFILNLFILILTTNSFNLLDLRPGRAIKVYLLIAAIILINYPLNQPLLLVFLFALIAYFPLDLKQRAMLGDTGSNLLGISCGISLILNFNLSIKMVILAFLIILHVYTEKKSLSVLIEKNSVLRFLDNLGR